MRYNWDKKLVKNILISSDFANTVNGGVSQPIVVFNKKEDHYLLRASVPGVKLEDIQVELADHHVILHHDVRIASGDNEFRFPRIIATRAITADVDYKNITATIEEGELLVVLPFSEIAGGYNKKIEVRK